MRLLVVEDEPQLLRGIARALREEHYAVDEAADGEEGLFKAESYDYDAIVLDLLFTSPPRLPAFLIISIIFLACRHLLTASLVFPFRFRKVQLIQQLASKRR